MNKHTKDNISNWIKDIKFRIKAYNYDAYFFIAMIYMATGYVFLWTLT